MKKIGPIAKKAASRTSIVVPLSMWMDDEMDAELSRSLDRESDRMAQDEAEDCVSRKDDEPLEEGEIYGILEELADFEELKVAAKPDYVAAVARVLSDELKFALDLIFVSSGETSSPPFRETRWRNCMPRAKRRPLASSQRIRPGTGDRLARAAG